MVWQGKGGAIFMTKWRLLNEWASFKIDATSFIDNVALQGGGALVIDGQVARSSLEGCEFRGNKGSQDDKGTRVVVAASG